MAVAFSWDGCRWANCVEGALWCVIDGGWVVLGLLGGDSLHPGGTLVRPGWRLYCRLGLLGLVISAEGALRCALDGGWAAVGNCRRGNLRRGCMGLRLGW